MWTRMTRRMTIGLVVLGLIAGCKRDKPTEPPDDEEPDPTADVRVVR